MTKKHKRKRAGCALPAALGLLAMLVLFAFLLRALQPQTQSPQPSQTPEPESQNVYRPEYYDKSAGLYTYNDPENGISSMVGIDVSQHQGTLDWNFWRDGGLDFAFIRIGLRGYGTGALVEDSFYQTNLSGAKNAGFKCGVYFYSQAVNAQEAREEADFVLTLLGGTPLEMPVVFDWEFPTSSDARTWNLPEEAIQDCAAAFCEEITAGGYTPMLYANGSTYNTYRADPRLDAVDMWYAQYTDGETYAEGYSIWQYTQTGTVNGSLSIDLNLAYLNREGELLSAAEIAALQKNETEE